MRNGWLVALFLLCPACGDEPNEYEPAPVYRGCVPDERCVPTRAGPRCDDESVEDTITSTADNLVCIAAPLPAPLFSVICADLWLGEPPDWPPWHFSAVLQNDGDPADFRFQLFVRRCDEEEFVVMKTMDPESWQSDHCRMLYSESFDSWGCVESVRAELQVISSSDDWQTVVWSHDTQRNNCSPYFGPMADLSAGCEE